MERQTQTWQNTGERFPGLIIPRITTALEGYIAHEQGKCTKRTAGYSNDDDVLRREFGIDMEPKVSESARGSRSDVADALGGLVE